MEKFLKKYLYFHRIDTYCIVNYYIKYIFTLKAVLIKAFYNETFLVKGKREILKYFFLYYVIILKWNTWVISSDPPFIKWHVRCTFETFISQSFLNQEIKIYFISFLNLLVWVSAMKCNVECRLPEEGKCKQM